MATRRTPIRQWEIEKSKANKIVARLLRHVMYTGPLTVPEPGTPEGQEPRYIPAKQTMSDSQVRAALGLLKKFLPDLKSIEHTGNPDKPVITEVRLTIIDPPERGSGEGVSAAADPESL